MGHFEMGPERPVECVREGRSEGLGRSACGFRTLQVHHLFSSVVTSLMEDLLPLAS